MCAITITYLLILATMIVKISKHIVRSIRHSMEKGMRHYLNDPVWKHTMDRWQFTLRCCGVNDFHDWYGISWLDKYHINIDSPKIQNLLLSKDHLHLPVVPWSCCNIQFPMQCFHDPIQQINSAHIWREQPELPAMSLNPIGCLEAIRYPIEMALVAFLVICILLILVQVAITIIARFLYTSCRNAVIMHRTADSAPGWLFGRDCLADKRGRSLSEVMLDLQKNDSDDDDVEDEEYDDEEEEETEDESKSLLKNSSPKSTKPPAITPRRDSLKIYKKRLRTTHENDYSASDAPNAPLTPLPKHNQVSNVVTGYTYHNPEDKGYKDSGILPSTSPATSRKHNRKSTTAPPIPKHESKFETLHRHFSPMQSQDATQNFDHGHSYNADNYNISAGSNPASYNVQSSYNPNYKMQSSYNMPQYHDRSHMQQKSYHQKTKPECEQSQHIQTFDYVTSSQSQFYSTQSNPVTSEVEKPSVQEFGSFQKYDVGHVQQEQSSRKYIRTVNSSEMKRQLGHLQSNLGDSSFRRLTTIQEADPSLPDKDYDDEFPENNNVGSMRYSDDKKLSHGRFSNIDSARNPVSERTEGALMLK